jgi:hypothetical protein
MNMNQQIQNINLQILFIPHIPGYIQSRKIKSNQITQIPFIPSLPSSPIVFMNGIEIH